jgi:hypothetical protein
MYKRNQFHFEKAWNSTGPVKTECKDLYLEDCGKQKKGRLLNHKNSFVFAKIQVAHGSNFISV